MSEKGPQDLPGRVLVGVAGWSYPDWKEIVYPRETHVDKLQYLSHFFDTIEVNTSFYSIPSRSMVTGWTNCVSHNPRFLFTLKLYKLFTHGDNIQEGTPTLVPSLVDSFKAALEPLQECRKLGALLMQFPYRFHYETKNLDYLLVLFETFREFPLALEVRHRSFHLDSFFKLLEDHQVAFANIDQPGVSHAMPITPVFTAQRLAYLRFHGRNTANWFDMEVGRDGRYDYDYSSQELEVYLGMVREFQQRAGTLYVIFNNHYRASEVKNALEFIHQLSGKPVKVMPKLLKAYPELRQIALPEETEPNDVFPGENYRLF
jgi:uncharacterized protein YecE (DUF72 family)